MKFLHLVLQSAHYTYEEVQLQKQKYYFYFYGGVELPLSTQA